MFILKWYDGNEMYQICGNSKSVWNAWFFINHSYRSRVNDELNPRWYRIVNDCGVYINPKGGIHMTEQGKSLYPLGE